MDLPRTPLSLPRPHRRRAAPRGARLRRALAALLVAATLPALACSRSGSAPRPAAPLDHLILITVDTWRGDHFATRQGGADVTPLLAARAASGARFAAHSSTAASTSPGIASLLTGLHPHRSGVISNSHVLQPHLPTLQRFVREAGFVTAAFIGNPILSPGAGFERDFDTYVVADVVPPESKARGGDVTAAAVRWLDARTAKGRFMMWVHLMDPHGPYEPPAEAVEPFANDAFGAARTARLLPAQEQGSRGGIPHYQQGYRRAAATPPSADPRDYRRRYAGEVRHVDRTVDDFLAALETRGLLARSLVVLTSDHGEALEDDHGHYFAHGHAAYEDQIAVPLVLWGRGVAPGERTHATSSVDLLPTTLGLLGLAPPDDTDGSDLFDTSERPVFARIPRQQAVRRGSWKLIWRGHGVAPLLYDLRGDPGELRDRSREQPAALERLKLDLTALREAPALARPRRRPPQSDEDRRRLEALGYN